MLKDSVRGAFFSFPFKGRTGFVFHELVQSPLKPIKKRPMAVRSPSFIHEAGEKTAK